jgi:hypothetical protein
LVSWPFLALAPGATALIAITLAGGTAAGAVAWVFDLGRLRAILRNRALPPAA